MRKFAVIFLLIAVVVGQADDTLNNKNSATEGLAFDQKLNASVPTDARFTDEDGNSVMLGDYLKTGPVAIIPAYYECPNICTVVIRGVFETLQALKYRPSEKYQILFMSIDPEEKPDLAAKKKRTYLKSFGTQAQADRIHFLTGDEVDIRKVTDSIGFRYRFDETLNQYLHPAGMVVVTPSARISRYLYGVNFDPRDMRLSLVEASENKIGSAVDHFLLYCYKYDPSQGKYGFAVMGALRVLGAATVTALAGFIFGSVRRDRRRKKRESKS